MTSTPTAKRTTFYQWHDDGLARLAPEALARTLLSGAAPAAEQTGPGRCLRRLAELWTTIRIDLPYRCPAELPPSLEGIGATVATSSVARYEPDLLHAFVSLHNLRGYLAAVTRMQAEAAEIRAFWSELEYIACPEKTAR